jgi:hypothetical protein
MKCGCRFVFASIVVKSLWFVPSSFRVTFSLRVRWVIGGVVYTVVPFYKRVRHMEGI